ncbi:MAG: hypothetical protein P8X57_03535 [Cyclobacteriaceae bacterium]
MRYYTGALFILLVLCISCKEEVEEPFCTNGSCAYEFLNNSQIEISWISQHGYFVEIVDGDKQVFKRTYNYQDSPNIVDDELTEILLFELERDVSSFKFTDEELTQANVLFARFCECFPGYRNVNSGTLEGTKTVNGTWRIKADLQVSSAVGPLKFEASFE